MWKFSFQICVEINLHKLQQFKYTHIAVIDDMALFINSFFVPNFRDALLMSHVINFIYRQQFEIQKTRTEKRNVIILKCSE